MINKILLAVIICLISMTTYAQSYNIGVRAGLNYSKWRGPLESSINEEYNTSSGFHFGLNYAQNFTDLFSMRLEVLYVQNGTKKHYDGESFYRIRVPNGADVTERGIAIYDLDISNAYLSFPLTAHFDINRKWEVFGGAYVSMLVGPRGSGLLDFTSIDNGDKITFFQSLDYDFDDDAAQEGNCIGTCPQIIVDGVIVTLPNFAGAYYQYNERRESLINFLDYGLIGGVSYNINRGFYISLRAEFGLSDITSDKVDISQSVTNEDGSFIYRDDKDTHFGIQTSFGFRF